MNCSGYKGYTIVLNMVEVMAFAEGHSELDPTAGLMNSSIAIPAQGPFTSPRGISLFCQSDKCRALIQQIALKLCKALAVGTCHVRVAFSTRLGSEAFYYKIVIRP